MSRGRRAATLWRNRRLLCPLRNTPRHSSLQTPLDLPRTPKPLNFFFPSHALLLACSRVNFSPICLRACLLIWFLCLHALRYFLLSPPITLPLQSNHSRISLHKFSEHFLFLHPSLLSLLPSPFFHPSSGHLKSDARDKL